MQPVAQAPLAVHACDFVMDASLPQIATFAHLPLTDLQLEKAPNVPPLLAHVAAVHVLEEPFCCLHVVAV